MTGASTGDLDPASAVRARRATLDGMFLRAADLGSVPDDGFVARQLAGVPR